MEDNSWLRLFPREDTCESESEYDGTKMGARISAIFVIMATSLFGTYFPILSSRHSFIRMPNWCFVMAKYFGSGVIVATAFIHLLEPANDALSDECLGGTFADYPWAYGICLMSLFAIFFAELCSYTFLESKLSGGQDHSHSHFGNAEIYTKEQDGDSEKHDDAPETQPQMPMQNVGGHYSHAKHHQDPEVIGTLVEDVDKEKYSQQLLSLFILEFGILFHSVFIGLSLSVAGEEFKSLYIVLVFHQMFEGLGLGTRIATTPWPKSRRWTPWLLGLGYGITTPIAIAIGLGVRHSYAPGSRKALITNGCFDAISAGILVYTGLVELMAHEFLFSDEFKGKGGGLKMLRAYFIMCCGAGLMALLGKWA